MSTYSYHSQLHILLTVSRQLVRQILTLVYKFQTLNTLKLRSDNSKLISSGESMLIVFKTDDSFNHRGFSLAYTAVESLNEQEQVHQQFHPIAQNSPGLTQTKQQ